MGEGEKGGGKERGKELTEGREKDTIGRVLGEKKIMEGKEWKGREGKGGERYYWEGRKWRWEGNGGGKEREGGKKGKGCVFNTY